MFRSASLDLVTGSYFKVGNKRAGTAHLIVRETGSVDYVNRRGEIKENLSEKEVVSIFNSGIDTLLNLTPVVEIDRFAGYCTV